MLSAMWLPRNIDRWPSSFQCYTRQLTEKKNFVSKNEKKKKERKKAKHAYLDLRNSLQSRRISAQMCSDPFTVTALFYQPILQSLLNCPPYSMKSRPVKKNPVRRGKEKKKYLNLPRYQDHNYLHHCVRRITPVPQKCFVCFDRLH